MKKNCFQITLQTIVMVGIFLTGVFLFSGSVSAAPIIANHNTTDITQIPESAVLLARAQLHIAYGHTSHGSQLTTGMSGLVSFMNGLGYPNNLYTYNSGGTAGALDLRDTPFSGASDLGNPDRVAWATSTRNYLDTNPGVNVVIWSWCGQVSNATAADIDTYLTLMNGLETDYPGVKFVYMTGHLDGGGETGNLHLRNEQIRNFCIANDKILYDFADIESYDPDGSLNFMRLRANDNCDYDSDGNGSLDRNWAVDWQNSHTEGIDWYSCSSAHSQSLNANRKAYAAWWLWARLAGWNECLPVPAGLTAVANPDLSQIELNWSDTATDPNEDAIIVQRQVNGGGWDVEYAVLPADTTYFVDSGLAPGNYQYRVVSHLDDDGSGAPCDSPPSNIASAQMIITLPPGAPSDLSADADSATRQIVLAWSDNADNEEHFAIQRRFNDTPWDNAYAEVGANMLSFMDINLAPGIYVYRVVAVNSYGESTASNEAAVEIIDIPLAPSALTATAQPAQGTIALTWRDNSGVETGFVIDRRVNGGPWQLGYWLGGADVTSYLDGNGGSSPLPAGTYDYRVSAYNDQGASLFSNIAQAVMSYETPAAPYNLQSSLAGFDISLTWVDASDNEAFFSIERRVGTGVFMPLAQLSAGSTNYIDTGLTPALTYSYRVTAVNAMGASGYSNETSQYIPVDAITLRLEDDDTGEVEDAFLSSSNPDTNYGSTNYLSAFERFIIKFNLPPELQDKRIVDAQVAFYGWNQSGFAEGEYLDLYRVTQAWSEATVTWNMAHSSTQWSIPGGDFDLESPVGQIPFAGGGDHAFFPPLDVTGLVQAWADGVIDNYGLMLIDNSVLSTGIKASEYSNGMRSYLEITYTPCGVDQDGDGDVDGFDLSQMASAFDGACLKAMADRFGQ